MVCRCKQLWGFPVASPGLADYGLRGQVAALITLTSGGSANGMSDPSQHLCGRTSPHVGAGAGQWPELMVVAGPRAGRRRGPLLEGWAG